MTWRNPDAAGVNPLVPLGTLAPLAGPTPDEMRRPGLRLRLSRLKGQPIGPGNLVEAVGVIIDALDYLVERA